MLNKNKKHLKDFCNNYKKLNNCYNTASNLNSTVKSYENAEIFLEDLDLKVLNEANDILYDFTYFHLSYSKENKKHIENEIYAKEMRIRTLEYQIKDEKNKIKDQKIEISLGILENSKSNINLSIIKNYKEEIQELKTNIIKLKALELLQEDNDNIIELNYKLKNNITQLGNLEQQLETVLIYLKQNKNEENLLEDIDKEFDQKLLIKNELNNLKNNI